MLKRLISTRAFAAIALLLSVQTTGAKAQAGGIGQGARQTANVRVNVSIFRTDTYKVVKDASKVVAWLSPIGQTQEISPDHTPYRMIQRNKMFEPSLLVIPIGSLVSFPNRDPWFHNVFSLYQGKRFDLGLYEAGTQREVRFNRPGASYIFCNIHPQMAAVILAIDSPYYGISDKTGHILIAGVPPGKYTLKVWYENTAPSALASLENTIEVDETSANRLNISIPASGMDLMKHKNLYGRDYDSQDAKPVY
jgi:plastocyanin